MYNYLQKLSNQITYVIDEREREREREKEKEREREIIYFQKEWNVQNHGQANSLRRNQMSRRRTQVLGNINRICNSS